MTPLVEAGHLTTADVGGFLLLADVWAQLVAVDQVTEAANGLTLVKVMDGRFGFFPAAMRKSRLLQADSYTVERVAARLREVQP